MPLQGDETKTELLDEAKDFDIAGRSSMSKTELQNAVSAQRATRLASQEPIILPDGLEVQARPEPPVETDEVVAAPERAEAPEVPPMTDAAAVERVEADVEADVEEPKKSTRGGKRR
jgi:hypothetical protein